MSSFFIRKNTPELREKLEAMGYYICPCCTFRNSVWLDAHTDDMSAHGIGYDSGNVFPYKLEGELEFFLKDNAEHSYPYYDCGESEELFLSMLKGKEVTP